MSGHKLPAGSIQEEKEAETRSSAIKTTNSFKGRIGRETENHTRLYLTSSFGEINLSLND
tara:strand:- start:22614 stop:22793 length:180 start_codon:yes stop_codon:yes gene_type:complete